jgi:hypothetical protein
VEIAERQEHQEPAVLMALLEPVELPDHLEQPEHPDQVEPAELAGSVEIGTPHKQMLL